MYERDHLKRSTFSFFDLLALLIFTFTITTLLQRLFGSFSINTIIGGLIAVLVMGICFVRFRPRHAYMMILSMICFLSAMFQASSFSIEVREWIYYITTVFLMNLLSTDENLQQITRSLFRFRKIIRAIVNLTCVFLAVLLFRGIGYQEKWGEGRYFIGLCNEPHTMASVCCLLLALIVLYYRQFASRKLWYALIALIPTFAILQTGARVFLIPAAIYMVMVINDSVHHPITRFIIYALSLAAFVYFILQSSMANKFLYALDTRWADSLLDAFTSGRSEIWATDINKYLSGNPLQLLVGSSFSQMYAVNNSILDLNIGSHNDIIGLLNGTGLIGAVQYLLILYPVFRKIHFSIQKRFDKILCMSYIILPLLLNGFYTYQHYVYSFFVLFILINFNNREVYTIYE